MRNVYTYVWEIVTKRASLRIYTNVSSNKSIFDINSNLFRWKSTEKNLIEYLLFANNLVILAMAY